MATLLQQFTTYLPSIIGDIEIPVSLFLELSCKFAREFLFSNLGTRTRRFEHASTSPRGAVFARSRTLFLLPLPLPPEFFIYFR